MADNFRYAQLQPFSLAGSGAIIGDTTIVLKSMTYIDGGVVVFATAFGTKGFATIQPGAGIAEEQISFSGITQNANGTATLTGVKTVLFISPYTETSGLAKTHAGSTSLIISNTSGFYNELTSKDDDETVNGLWTFVQPPISATNPILSTEVANKAYVDGVAIAGAPDASDTVKGITKLSVAAVAPTSPIAVGDNDGRVPTQAENNALVGNNTDIAVGTGNTFVTQTGLQKAAECYAASATGNDTYVITLSPVPISLVNGMTLRFKPDTANTGAATLNVNGIGALAIVTGLSTALVTGDIVANQVCEVVYNSTGTVWQLINPASAVLLPVTHTNGTTTKNAADGNGTQNIAHGLGKIPKKANITARLSTANVAFGLSTVASAYTTYNGTTQSSVSTYAVSAAANNSTTDNTFTLNIAASGATTTYVGVVTFDATNIIITWTATGSPTGTYVLLWEAQA